VFRVWGNLSIYFKVFFVVAMLLVSEISKSEQVIFWIYLCGIAWVVVFETANIILCKDKTAMIMVDWTGFYNKNKEIEFFEKFGDIFGNQCNDNNENPLRAKIEKEANESIWGDSQDNKIEYAQKPNDRPNNFIFLQITVGAVFALFANPNIINNKALSIALFVLFGLLYVVISIYTLAKTLMDKDNSKRVIGFIALLAIGTGILMFEYWGYSSIFSVVGYVVWGICDCCMLYLSKHKKAKTIDKK